MGKPDCYIGLAVCTGTPDHRALKRGLITFDRETGFRQARAKFADPLGLADSPRSADRCKDLGCFSHSWRSHSLAADVAGF